jgi:hypothetical protein
MRTSRFLRDYAGAARERPASIRAPPALYPWTGRPAGGYSAFMLLLRRCAALAAAYAVALQLVLSAFAAVAPLALATEAGFAICRGGDSAPAAPAAHDPCSACLTHCAGAGAAPQRAASPFTWPPGVTSFVQSFMRAAAPSAATQARDHSPRAPPFA